MTEEPRLDGKFLLDEYARIRRTGTKFVLAGVLVVLVGIIFQAARFSSPPPLDYSKLGVHLLLDDGHNRWPVDVWDEHLAAAAPVASPGGIAVQVIRADDLDTDRWQLFMDLCAKYDLTPVLRLATTYDREQQIWNAPPVDADGGYQSWAEQSAAFLNELQWPGDQKHVILLNEPNNGAEWGGKPDPEAYANLVVTVVGVLREQVPGVVILNAALDLYTPNTGDQPFPGTDLFFMDADSFLDTLYRVQPDLFTLFDVWNSHAYPADFSEPPNVQSYQFDFLQGTPEARLAPPEGVNNRGINGYEWELWKLAQFGVDDIPVMITETGWRHTESGTIESVDAGEGYPDAAAVARYMDLALRGEQSTFATSAVTWLPWLADDRVIGIAPFALNGIPEEWGHTNWLQLDSSGQILDTYAPYDLISNYPFP